MPDSARVSNENLQSQIRGLGSQIDSIKRLLEGNEDRIRCLERAGDKTTPLTEKRLEILEKLTESYAKALDQLKDIVIAQAQSIKDLTSGFETMQKIWKWALGIFTAVIITLI